MGASLRCAMPTTISMAQTKLRQRSQAARILVVVARTVAAGAVGCRGRVGLSQSQFTTERQAHQECAKRRSTTSFLTRREVDLLRKMDPCATDV